ncbi:2-hydroxyacid dehydrogenase [Paenibacillus pasadenensis]|uniref:2-hydroxyacid dehydrogenase n=1 Tax=Paenibacillus TaxID=44249 RepID=UPI0003F919CB|nr:NAD(P)-dependent oxidoreductase [Paenibacillus pasadenensis]
MPKPICYAEVSLHPLAWEQLKAHYEITSDDSRLPEASAALVYSVPDHWAFSESTSRLKAVACHSCSSSAAAWMKEQGIALTLAHSLWRTVAEHTLALMMAAARNIVPADRAVRNGEWSGQDLKIPYSGWDFQQKTIGIWGMGKIGIELAGLISGFGMNRLYNDCRRLPAEQEQRLGIAYASVEDMLAQADYFCILLPLNEQTRGALGKEQFARMKKGCILINTARAGIIEEQAFQEALENGTIGAAGLDVFWRENDVQPAYLAERTNVVLTPHLGGSTYECDMVLVNAVLERK